jgi:murein DD-endopeptidase MepM/ murein hydrolase activator NlpD
MQPTRINTRRFSFTSVILSIALVVASAPARAQTTSGLGNAGRDLSRYRSAAERIADEFARTEAQRGMTENEIARTQSGITQTRTDIAKLQDRLKDRVRAAYRMRGIGFFELLLNANSFRDFNVRLMSLERQTLADEGLILELRRKRALLDIQQRQLESQKGVLADRLEAYRAQGRRLTITLAQANALVARLRNRLTRAQIASLFSISKATGGRTVPLDVCPVDPPRVVTNSFGAPRGGGTRRHKGNDIMAAMGTPLRAVNSGTITRLGNGGLGGIAFRLWDGSTDFYYAHLSRRNVSAGQHVSAGQLVGAVGDSGDARGGPPHLHFEVHPGGGPAIDPYPSLSAVC